MDLIIVGLSMLLDVVFAVTAPRPVGTPVAVVQPAGPVVDQMEEYQAR